jgi:hypothetical protein
MSYCQTTLERLAQNDKLERFQTRGFLKGFGNEPTIILNDEFASSGVDDSHMGSKGGEIGQKHNLVQTLARKHNHNKEPSQGGFDGRLQDYE